MPEQNEENDTLEIDPDHPWIQAAVGMEPSPVPTMAKVDGVMLEQEGKDIPAAQLQVVCPNGAFTFFLPLNVLDILIKQGVGIMQQAIAMQEQSLVVAKNMDGVSDIADIMKRMKGNGS